MKTLGLALAALSFAAMPAYAGNCSGKSQETFANHHKTEKKTIVGVAEAAGFDTLLAAAKAAASCSIGGQVS